MADFKHSRVRFIFSGDRKKEVAIPTHWMEQARRTRSARSAEDVQAKIENDDILPLLAAGAADLFGRLHPSVQPQVYVVPLRARGQRYPETFVKAIQGFADSVASRSGKSIQVMFVEPEIFSPDGKLLALDGPSILEGAVVKLFADATDDSMRRIAEGQNIGLAPMPPVTVDETESGVQSGNYLLAFILADMLAGVKQGEDVDIAKIVSSESIRRVLSLIYHRTLDSAAAERLVRNLIQYKGEADDLDFYRVNSFPLLTRIALTRLLAGARLVAQAVASAA